MKKIVSGGANKSYGIQVARLAWVISEITERAGRHLECLESENQKKQPKTTALFSQYTTIKDPQTEKIKSLLNSFDLNNITPLQALQLLTKLKDEIA
jgi:DNA mismatch repair protein MutS